MQKEKYNEVLEDLLEDIEAAACTDLRERVKSAREGLKFEDMISLSDLAAQYGI